MKREVLLVFGLFGMGGAQRRAITIANGLTNQGYRVSILSVQGDNYSISDEFYNIADGIEIIKVPVAYEGIKNTFRAKSLRRLTSIRFKLLKKAEKLSRQSSFRDALYDKRRALKDGLELRTVLQSHRGAVLVVFGFNIFELCFFASRGLGCKLVYAETNAINKFKDDRNFRTTLQYLRKAKVRVFQTQCERAELGFAEDPTSIVIHNPLAKDMISPYYGERSNTIVNFCAFKAHKNLLLLVDAFEILHKDHSDYKLYIYGDTPDVKKGSGRDYREDVLAYIKQKHLEDDVFICQATNEIHKIIRDAAMFVSSSDYEGLSNSMIEAMALGLPCVCTDCDGGGAREMIVSGENGLLVKKGDPYALAKGMSLFVDDPGFARICGRNAVQIREKLCEDVILKKWIDVIGRLL